MFTGRFEPIQGEGELTTPSFSQSTMQSFQKGFLAPLQLTPSIDPQAKHAAQDALDGIQETLNRPGIGTGQEVADLVANFAGSVLNPYSLLAGEGIGVVAGKAVSGAAGLIGKYLPFNASLVSTAIAKKPLSKVLGENTPNFIGKHTVSEAVTGTVRGYGMATGFSIPEEIANTYDKKTDTMNWWGGVKESFADGGVGLALMAVPYLGGTLWGKIFKSAGRETKSPIPMPNEGAAQNAEGGAHPSIATIDSAIESGHIDHAEGSWFKDYINGTDTKQNLESRAVEFLIKDGHPVDAATKKVLLKILSPEDVGNLQTALSDQLASHVPEEMKSHMTDFMASNKVDTMRSNTKMLDGLEGVVDFIKKRLEKSPEEMADIKKIIQESEPISAKKINPITQSKVYQMVKSGRAAGLAIPRQVEKRLRIDEKINKLKKLIDNYSGQHEKFPNKKLLSKIKEHQNRIDELEKTKPTFLSHNEEIAHIKERLTKNGKVKSNFKTRREYERLRDLTAVPRSSKRIRDTANSLLHELHLSHEYDRQENFANFLNAITHVMRSNVGKLADPEKVTNYLRERIQNKTPNLEPLEKTEIKGTVREEQKASEVQEEQGKEINIRDKQIKSFDEEMKKAPDNLKSDYQEARAQLKEFSESASIFNNLIKCAVGSLNG